MQSGECRTERGEWRERGECGERTELAAGESRLELKFRSGSAQRGTQRRRQQRGQRQSGGKFKGFLFLPFSQSVFTCSVFFFSYVFSPCGTLICGARFLFQRSSRHEFRATKNLPFSLRNPSEKSE